MTEKAAHLIPGARHLPGCKQPERVKQLRPKLEEWQRSVRDSYDGKDFAKP